MTWSDQSTCRKRCQWVSKITSGPPPFWDAAILLWEQHSNDMVRSVYMYKEVSMGFQNNKWFTPPPHFEMPQFYFGNNIVMTWSDRSTCIKRCQWVSKITSGPPPHFEMPQFYFRNNTVMTWSDRSTCIKVSMGFQNNKWFTPPPPILRCHNFTSGTTQ